MGASGWTYFVPFQPDMAAALGELRARVFKGDYFQPAMFYGAMVENMPDMPPDVREALASAVEEMRARKDPQTIEELIELSGEEGTHSILDMTEISASPGFGALAPLEPEALRDLFGTVKPTHQMIEAKIGEILDCRDRWEGTYIIVYQGDSPCEIFFAGFSGD